MVTTAGRPSVERTQEGRVLECARLMDAGDSHVWLVPILNGRIRLEKPPLAYWLSALSFRAFGVSEWSGRVTFALAIWLAGAVTFWFTRAIFGPRAAFFAAGSLLGSYLFSRFVRLAETDTLIALFNTLAVAAFWRASARRQFSVRSRAVAAGWFWAGWAAVGLSVMSKGLSAAFPVVFVLSFLVVERRWDRLRLMFISGSPLALLIVAAPWFAYVLREVGGHTFWEEIRVATEGEGHNASVINYVPGLFVALLPWSAVAIAALIASMRRWKRDERHRAAVLSIAAVLLPLCLAKQRQNHYLIPSLPLISVLTGWAVDRALRTARLGPSVGGGKLRQSVRSLLAGTMICTAAATIATPWAGRLLQAPMTTLAWVVALAAIAGSAMLILTMVRRGLRPAAVALMTAMPFAMVALHNVLLPELMPMNNRRLATDLVSMSGVAAVATWGKNDVPLGFEMRRELPAVNNVRQLSRFVAEQRSRQATGQILVIIRDDSDEKPRPLPRGLVVLRTIEEAGTVVRICRVEDAEVPPPDVASSPEP